MVYRDPPWWRIEWNTLKADLRRYRRQLGPVGTALTVLALLLPVVGATVLVMAMPWSGQSGSAGSTDPGRTAPAGQPGLAGPGGPVTGSGSGSGNTERDRAAAVAWVAANVSRESVLACDGATCSALAARGYPANALIRISGRDGDVRRSDIAVVTDAVRARLGADLAELLSPQRLAVFGTGAGAVEVAPVVLTSAAAQEAALAADLASRRAAGRQLARNPRLAMSEQARNLLTAGRVDSRVLTMLPPLLSMHRIEVSAFHGSAAETGLGVPLRMVDISRIDGRRVDPDRNRTMNVAGFARAQRPPYGPGRVSFVKPGSVLRIAFPAPGPLGLMSRR